jgi:alpha-L-rhamnosidase
LAWEANWGIYGKKLALLCQIHLQYTDGSSEWIVSDDSWQSSNKGPVRKNELYYGEVYDAQMEQSGWDKPGFDARAWSKTTVAPYPFGNLIAPEGVPVRRISEIRPLKIQKRGGKSWMVDMGQNMVGWMRLKVRGERGEQIFLRHGEVLSDSEGGGPLYVDNLRGAKQLISYTLKGGGEEVFEPRFTFMGFRYVNVVNYPGELTAEDIVGIVVHSDMPPTGTFECSNPLINQLQKNIVWGQKGNFLDVPTDCPQRDERLGWTGDAQVFARTAAYNMDVAAFFDKWLRDVAASQKPNGAVPHVIPDVLNKQDAVDGSVSAGWGDAAVIIPWTMYQVYADRQMLERQYPSMKAYVDYIRGKSGENLVWKGGSVFGDWLFYRPNPKDHPAPDAYTNHDYISTAFFAYSADLVRKSAEVLGKTEDAAFYGGLYEKIRKVFIREYITGSGRTASDSQTSYVLALMFGLVPEESRANAAQYLIDDIRSRKNHLSTGFLGTPYLCHVLTQHGATDLAYQLLLQQTYPSWLYPVKMGATTIWERWDGQKTDGTYQDPGMNSFNHYAYGAIGDWMYQVSAGIQAGKPGYKEIVIVPHPTDSLQYVRATYESNYGKIGASWERVGEKIVLKVTIPANTTATIRFLGAEPESIRENGKSLTEADGLKKLPLKGDDVEVKSGSGFYLFEYKLIRKL